MDEIRPSFFLFIQIVSRSLIAPTKRKLNLSTMITQNHSDFIIAVIGNSIKREGERQKHPRYIIVSRMFRFLSPTKLNRYEQAVYSEAHTIQPLCLAGVRNLFLTPALRL